MGCAPSSLAGAPPRAPVAVGPGPDGGGRRCHRRFTVTLSRGEIGPSPDGRMAGLADEQGGGSGSRSMAAFAKCGGTVQSAADTAVVANDNPMESGGGGCPCELRGPWESQPEQQQQHEPQAAAAGAPYGVAAEFDGVAFVESRSTATATATTTNNSSKASLRTATTALASSGSLRHCLSSTYPLPIPAAPLPSGVHTHAAAAAAAGKGAAQGSSSCIVPLIAVPPPPPRPENGNSNNNNEGNNEFTDPLSRSGLSCDAASPPPMRGGRLPTVLRAGSGEWSAVVSNSDPNNSSMSFSVPSANFGAAAAAAPTPTAAEGRIQRTDNAFDTVACKLPVPRARKRAERFHSDGGGGAGGDFFDGAEAEADGGGGGNSGVASWTMRSVETLHEPFAVPCGDSQASSCVVHFAPHSHLGDSSATMMLAERDLAAAVAVASCGGGIAEEPLPCLSGSLRWHHHHHHPPPPPAAAVAAAAAAAQPRTGTGGVAPALTRFARLPHDLSGSIPPDAPLPPPTTVMRKSPSSLLLTNGRSNHGADGHCIIVPHVTRPNDTLEGSNKEPIKRAAQRSAQAEPHSSSSSPSSCFFPFPPRLPPPRK